MDGESLTPLQVTVNNQIVVGTLMNLCDDPNRVSIYQVWRESDFIQRVPIIVTGNDLSHMFAPLIRDGRMSKFYWKPDREDLSNILHQMYKVSTSCHVPATASAAQAAGQTVLCSLQQVRINVCTYFPNALLHQLDPLLRGAELYLSTTPARRMHLCSPAADLKRPHVKSAAG